MVSSDLGACEWFVWDLRRSGLIDRGQLDQVVGEFLKRNPRAEPPALAEFLVAQSILSPFQAERLLQGKTQGLVLGPYVLADAIGQGSMGQVYKATSKTDSQSYAVKVLPRRSMWNVRLARRQVRAFGQFTHPAVVPFIDVGTSGGQHYLVWPLAEGETLEARVNREGKLAPDVAAGLVAQVANGLAQAHQNGLFHGLIKPSNILIGADGQARILDFGIGSLLAENEGESLVDTMSTANTLTSGLDCASPESVMDPTNRTTAGDQYSLGCVLYFCLTGRYPFADGTAVEKMMAHQFKQPQSVREVVPAVPEGLATIVDRMMQKAPESRYPAVDEIVEALQPFAADIRRGSAHDRLRAAAAANQAQRPSARPQPAPPRPTAASAQVSTPPGGPLTPVPNSQPGLGSAQARALPTRASMADAAPRGMYPTPIPTVPDAVPVAVPVPTARPQVAPVAPSGWVEPPKQGASLGLFMVFAIAALVTIGVYFLGKNFLFPN
jgi:serine/threonine protein kinase